MVVESAYVHPHVTLESQDTIAAILDVSKSSSKTISVSDQSKIGNTAGVEDNEPVSLNTVEAIPVLDLVINGAQPSPITLQPSKPSVSSHSIVPALNGNLGFPLPQPSPITHEPSNPSEPSASSQPVIPSVPTDPIHNPASLQNFSTEAITAVNPNVVAVTDEIIIDLGNPTNDSRTDMQRQSYALVARGTIADNNRREHVNTATTRAILPDIDSLLEPVIIRGVPHIIIPQDAYER
ncbi:hypothetical protein NE237_017299 [Protea cynaroides]|uniref:Uncharacterized protein n=1 Tax=Protea cynaroides TaxID=273540 RepID=A0A9Q0K7U4_9MAGN|nr:hypothetical protein NE237_017299 [Protea cynaroides]